MGLGGTFLVLLSALSRAVATLVAQDTGTTIDLRNDRFSVSAVKANGTITKMTLDGQDLLGSGGRTYLDCVCILAGTGQYTPGSTNATTSLIQGTDSSNVSWAGIVLSDTYTPSGQFFQQYWFLRDGETGLHSFSRLAYNNASVPNLRNLQEFRTLFRPSTSLWTHLSSTNSLFAPLPSANATAHEEVAQDATWWLGNTPDDPYFKDFASYFTKYTFSDSYRDLNAHGMFADGSTSNGTSFGAWLVMNTKETYFGGPIHSDLLVDGITYNYIVSNHHGDGTPNITTGFDRTFGPQFNYFNSGKNASLEELRRDAEQFANSTWNADFYDSIAPFVANLVPSSDRGRFAANFSSLPSNATRIVAVLSVNGSDFQDNVVDVDAYQYWANLEDRQSSVEIPRVKAGIYRLTVYAAGAWGWFVQDGVEVKAGNLTHVDVNWVEESAGKELWRLGFPDKTSGEFLHGFAPDETHPLHPPQYRIYWGAYNFTADFPDGVNFTIGSSDISRDWNYVHWNVFTSTFMDNKTYILNPSWTINFDIGSGEIPENSSATFTIQLAGVKTASGNTDVLNGPFSDFNLTTVVNNHEALNWTIQHFQSSSCAVRSAVSCYQLSNKLQFPGNWLVEGSNKLVLSLPGNATDSETAVLPGSLYVQYDALRLEVSV